MRLWPLFRPKGELSGATSPMRVALMLVLLIGLPTVLLVSADLRELGRDRATVRASLAEAHRTQAAALAADISAQLRRRLARLHVPDDRREAARLAGELNEDKPFVKDAFWIDREARLNGRETLPAPSTIADLPLPVGGGDPVAAEMALRDGTRAELALHDDATAQADYRQALLLSSQVGMRAHAAFALGRLAEHTGHPRLAASYYRAADQLLGDGRDEDGVPYGLLADLRLAALEPDPETVADLKARLDQALSAQEAAAYDQYLDRAVASSEATLARQALLASASATASAPSLASMLKETLWPHVRGRDLSEPRWIRLDGPDGPELYGVAGTPKDGYVGFQVDLKAIATDYVPRWAQRVSLDPTSEATFRVLAGRAPNSVEVRLEPPFDFARASIQLRENLVEQRLHAQFLRSLAAMGLILVVVCAGGWALYRGITRELGFARMQAAFVAGVSHELKTPLTSIKMYADLLALGMAKDPSAAARTLVAEGDRLARLIDRVLDFARIQRGAKTYNPVRLDALEVVNETLEILDPTISEGGFEITVESSPTLPPVRADRDAILQVLLNLVGNALKYSGTSRRLDIRLSAQAPREGGHEGRRPPAVRIEIQDYGLGIPKREHGRIFRPFHRVGPADGPGGSGLGLALVREYVSAHDGEILVDSEPGRGSTFTVIWPAFGTEAALRPSQGAA